MFLVAGLLCLVSVVVTLTRWPDLRSDGRSYDDCFKDVRAMNTYNSYFLGATIVFFGLVAGTDSQVVPASALWLFLGAFVCSSVAIFFFPIKKPIDGGHSAGAKRRWLLALIPTQWTVILGGAAIINVALAILLGRSP